MYLKINTLNNNKNTLIMISFVTIPQYYNLMAETAMHNAGRPCQQGVAIQLRPLQRYETRQNASSRDPAGTLLFIKTAG